MTNQSHLSECKPSQVEKLLGLNIIHQGEVEEGASDLVFPSLRIWTQSIEKDPRASQEVLAGFTSFGPVSSVSLGMMLMKSEQKPNPYRDQLTQRQGSSRKHRPLILWGW
jgi:hypothetical protein